MLRHVVSSSVAPACHLKLVCAGLHTSVCAHNITTHTTHNKRVNHDTGCQVTRSTSSRKVKDNGLGTPHLLHPFVLGQRLQRLCDKGLLDAAVDKLRIMPKDAQNAVVWNMLIVESMKAKRFQLAYSLYTDMKRRGFTPTFPTYSAMLQGLSFIENWKMHTKQLDRAHALFQALQEFVETTVERAPQDLADMHNGPVNAYLKILGSAGLYQRMFDVYYSLPETDPLSANAFTHTVMFRALMGREEVPAEGGLLAPERNAAEVRFLWQRMQKMSEKPGGFAIDAFAISAAIRALATGRLIDHTFAFSIMHDYLGLGKPGGEAPPPPRVALSSPLFQDILELCNRTRNFDYSTHWIRQVLYGHVVPDGDNIPDRAHIQQALVAHAALAARNPAAHDEPRKALELLEHMLQESALDVKIRKFIKPDTSTYEIIMATCWLHKDWSVAQRALHLMTGYNPKDFADGIAGEPRREERLTGQSLRPNTIVMGYLVRTALRTRDRAIMRQCLRLIHHFGGPEFLDYEPPAKRAHYVPHHRQKIAETLVQLVDEVMKEGGLDEQTQARWIALAGEAKNVVAALRDKPPKFVPLVELLGPRQSSTDRSSKGPQGKGRTTH